MKNGIIITKTGLLVTIVAAVCSISFYRNTLDSYSVISTVEGKIAASPIVKDVGRISASFGETEIFFDDLDVQISK
jgi:hypothetical protein